MWLHRPIICCAAAETRLRVPQLQLLAERNNHAWYDVPQWLHCSTLSQRLAGPGRSAGRTRARTCQPLTCGLARLRWLHSQGRRSRGRPASASTLDAGRQWQRHRRHRDPDRWPRQWRPPRWTPRCHPPCAGRGRDCRKRWDGGKRQPPLCPPPAGRKGSGGSCPAAIRRSHADRRRRMCAGSPQWRPPGAHRSRCRTRLPLCWPHWELC
mmetsp:Transcript_9192/g.27598  ORF Transcript_9192/g.27598 Transcript_9192/m.27598 type:complete len:210 (+) Transcript_9192:76-705(+)